MKRKPDTDLVPANWPVLIFMIFFFVPLVLFICIAGEQWFFMFFLAFGLWLIMDNSRSYHCDAEGITCCFMGIRVSGIAWKDISQVGAAAKPAAMGAAPKKVLYLTIGATPKADSQNIQSYGMDRRGVLTWPDNKNTRAIVDKYYSELDYEA